MKHLKKLNQESTFNLLLWIMYCLAVLLPILHPNHHLANGAPPIVELCLSENRAWAEYIFSPGTILTQHTEIIGGAPISQVMVWVQDGKSRLGDQ